MFAGELVAHADAGLRPQPRRAAVRFYPPHFLGTSIVMALFWALVLCVLPFTRASFALFVPASAVMALFLALSSAFWLLPLLVMHALAENSLVRETDI